MAEVKPSVLSSEVWDGLVKSATRDLNGKIAFPKPQQPLNISINQSYNQTDVQIINDFAKEVSAICPGYTPRISANDSTAPIQVNIVPKADFPKYIPDREISGSSFYYWTYSSSTNSIVSAVSVIDSLSASTTRTNSLRLHLLWSLGFLGSTGDIFANGIFTSLGQKVLAIQCSNLIRPGTLLSVAPQEIENSFYSGSGAKPILKPEINLDQLSAGIITVRGAIGDQLSQRIIGLEWTIQSGSREVGKGYIDNSGDVSNDVFAIKLSSLKLQQQLYGLTLRYKAAAQRQGLVVSEVFGAEYKSTFYFRTSDGACAGNFGLPCPTLKVKTTSKSITLRGTAVPNEGDILVYVKKVGTSRWIEQAKTAAVTSAGTFKLTLARLNYNATIRVMQEGTDNYSKIIIVKR